MPNFEADDVGGGYVANLSPTISPTSVSNSLTRASVPASSSSPAGGAAAASGLQSYGGGGTVSLGSGTSGGSVSLSRGSLGPAGSLGYGGGGRAGQPGSVTLGSGSSSQIVSGSGVTPALIGQAPTAIEPGTTVAIPLPEARPLHVSFGAGLNSRSDFDPETMNFQVGYNQWAREHGYRTIKEDGKFGKETKRANATIRAKLGLGGSAATIDDELRTAVTGPGKAPPQPPTAPLIPAPGVPLPRLRPDTSAATPLDPALVRQPDIPGDISGPDVPEKLIPLEPLPEPAKPLPGDVTFLSTHPEFRRLKGSELVEKGSDLLTPFEGGYLTEEEKLRGQTGATPLPHPISTPNALVEAAVQSGPLGRPINTPATRTPQGAKPLQHPVSTPVLPDEGYIVPEPKIDIPTKLKNRQVSLSPPDEVEPLSVTEEIGGLGGIGAAIVKGWQKIFGITPAEGEKPATAAPAKKSPAPEAKAPASEKKRTEVAHPSVEAARVSALASEEYEKTGEGTKKLVQRWAIENGVSVQAAKEHFYGLVHGAAGLKAGEGGKRSDIELDPRAAGQVASADDDLSIAEQAMGMETEPPDGEEELLPGSSAIKPAEKQTDDNYWFSPSSLLDSAISEERIRGYGQPPSGYYTKDQIKQIYELYRDMGFRDEDEDPEAEAERYIQHYKGNFKQDVPMSQGTPQNPYNSREEAMAAGGGVYRARDKSLRKASPRMAA